MTTHQQQTVDLVGHNPISAADLHAKYWCSVTVQTLSRDLAAGFEDGVLDRTWKGNQRYGCWVYKLKS